MTLKFTDHTFLRDDKGEIRSFKPGDKVPSWAEDQITNDALLHDTGSTETDEQRAARKAAKKAEKEQVAQAQAQLAAAVKAAANAANQQDAAAGSDDQSDNSADEDLDASDDDELGSEAPEVVKLKIPPKSGEGSSRDAWAEYARKAIAQAGLAVDIDDADTRTDIIAGLEQAGIPTEE